MSMSVFVTGGAGYIGRAVVRRLARAGHAVAALVRSEAQVPLVKDLGAEAVRGDLADPASYREARGADAVIHIACDFGRGPRDVDRTAVDSFLSALGPRQALVYTSDLWLLGPTGGEPADEAFPGRDEAYLFGWRVAQEKRVLECGGTAAVVRPGYVYGGDGGLIGKFFSQAVREGVVTYVGDGRNRWPMIHREDLAELYLAVVERRAKGVFHGVEREAVPVAELARAVARAAGLSADAVRAWPREEARRVKGQAVDGLCLDQTAVSRRGNAIGWSMPEKGFLERVQDVFDEWKRAGR